jgi:hypothetical protein
MNAIISFLNDNYIYIITIIAIVLSLLVYISFNKIEMDRVTDKKVVQTVTVETFINGINDGINDGIPDKNILFQSTPYTETDSEEKELDFNGANSFCENYRGQSGELNKACEYLTNDNCKSSSCCVLVQGSNGNKCMAGSANGPTYKKDVDGNLISIDSYYYKGKQYTTMK